MMIIATLVWALCAFILIKASCPDFKDLLLFLISILFSIASLAEMFSLSLFLGISFCIFKSAMIVLPLLIVVLRHLIKPLPFSSFKSQKIALIPLSILLLCLYFFSAKFLNVSKAWGEWDAVAIWSFHSKFLVSEKGLQQLYFNNHKWPHADYPLMLPAIIAMFWKSSGMTSAFVPLIIAYLTSLSLLAFSFVSLCQKKLLVLAIPMLIFFSFGKFIVLGGAMQYADTLLATFILISLVLAEYTNENKTPVLLFLLGFFSASCSWIKNEGILFFVVFILLYFIYNQKKRWKKFIPVLAGMILPVLLLLVFKLNYAKVNDLINEKAGENLSLINYERFHLLMSYVKTYFWEHFKVLLIMLFVSCFLNRKYFLSLPFIVLFCTFCAYLLIYLITPHDLEWHLNTSFSRLALQIVPSLICTCCLHFGTRYFANAKDN